MSVIEFDIMYINKKVGYVKIDPENDIFIAESYSNVLGEMAWNKDMGQATYDDVMEWLESRVFPKTRVNCDELLELLGIGVYSPLLICKKTHGAMMDDFNWIRFAGENLTFRDVALRSDWEGLDDK